MTLRNFPKSAKAENDLSVNSKKNQKLDIFNLLMFGAILGIGLSWGIFTAVQAYDGYKAEKDLVAFNQELQDENERNRPRLEEQLGNREILVKFLDETLDQHGLSLTESGRALSVTEPMYFDTIDESGKEIKVVVLAKYDDPNLNIYLKEGNDLVLIASTPNTYSTEYYESK